jgi:hypothetical protein
MDGELIFQADLSTAAGPFHPRSRDQARSMSRRGGENCCSVLTIGMALLAIGGIVTPGPQLKASNTCFARQSLARAAV